MLEVLIFVDHERQNCPKPNQIPSERRDPVEYLKSIQKEKRFLRRCRHLRLQPDQYDILVSGTNYPPRSLSVLGSFLITPKGGGGGEGGEKSLLRLIVFLGCQAPACPFGAPTGPREDGCSLFGSTPETGEASRCNRTAAQQGNVCVCARGSLSP